MLQAHLHPKVLICLACALAPALCRAQATSYTISTFAGTGVAGYFGDGLAPANARLNGPVQLALDSSHNLYIADTGNQRVRKVSGGKVSTVAGLGSEGYSGDGGPATVAQLSSPYGLYVDPAGNLYIADFLNHIVREVTTDGKINTVDGNNSLGYGYSGDGGPATSAQLNKPFGVAEDAAGNLYISDSFNDRIRVVTPGGNINTVAGNGNYQTPPEGAYSGDGGPATQAALNEPFGIAVDPAGNIYFADSHNNRIRKITPGGTITTVAGNGTAGFSGDGGTATSAQLNEPYDVKVDAYGDLFIVDYNNNCIRMVTTDGIITTIAGSPTAIGYAGDGGPALSAQLNYPTGLAVDTDGKVYIADSNNNVIRLLTPAAPSIGAGGVVSATAFGGASAIAPGSWIEIYGTNLSTGRRSWTSADFNGASAPTSLDGTSVKIGGQSAFVDYISGTQVNAQVPSNVPTGSQSVTVTSRAGTSAAFTVTVNATQPGLLAPSSFQIGGVPYIAALFSDGTTFVLPPGAIPGVPSRRAKAGDTIVLYGIGFGPVTPNIPAGQIASQSSQLVVAPQILFAGTPATVTYAGLAPNFVGLYQFNVVVPGVAAGDKVPVTFTLGGAKENQTLYTAIQ